MIYVGVSDGYRPGYLGWDPERPREKARVYQDVVFQEDAQLDRPQEAEQTQDDATQLLVEVSGNDDAAVATEDQEYLLVEATEDGQLTYEVRENPEYITELHPKGGTEELGGRERLKRQPGRSWSPAASGGAT